ncbi:related to DNA polymerase V [Sporisorium reilianum f. sp. reilianum]|uniref:Related to DNA polymerase V n=1 Tax=Sporisorium reilianum f. sp. reilianum TaxID=72559 RepID=A0A2N8U7P5_9BASI|nr:related to DNA polymerase V [Sporisorium reilianum f. sp. reilianum]
MNGNNLQLFWEIASSDQDARLASANQLVQELLSQQDVLASSSKITLDLPTPPESSDADQHDNDHDPSSALTVDEQEADAVEEALGNRTVADLMYALRRLLRGLASPRESSRLGFAVVLTELLSRIRYAVTANEILTLVLKYSNPQVAASRQEQKDFMFAKLFGIMSLVQSDLLVQPTATIHDFKRPMRILIALSSDKPWMAESCAWVMVNAVAQLQRPEVQIDWADAAQSWMTRQISSTKELSPEKLAVMLQLSHGAGADFFHNVALPSMRKEHPLSTANLGALARVLKEAIPSENEAAAPVGARSRWQAKIHFVWDLILDIFFDDAASNAETRIASFPDFYRVVVDETLFAAASSHDRKSWGFQVFQRALPRASDTDKPMLFTPNFMRTLINQLGNRERLLHRAAVKATETIQEVVKQQPHLGFVLVTQLIGKNGHQNFDSITKTKTVEHVLSALDTHRVREYVKHLGDMICQGIDTEDEDELTEITNRRKWALDQLLFLVRTPTVPKDDQLLVDILAFLAAHGYFTMQKPLKKRFLLERLPTPAFTDSLKQVTRSRFLSSVSELAKQASSSAAGRKTPGVAQDGQLWLAKAHDILLQLEKDKSFKSIFDHDDEIAAKLADGVRCLDKVRKYEAKSTDADVKERARAFQSLLLSALLVSADAADGASDLVEPLSACADKLFPAATAAAARKAKQVAEVAEEDGVSGIALLCECLLSCLELSSAFLRASASNAFEAFAQDMTKESIGLLLSHLGTAEAAAAEQDEDEDVDDEDVSEEDDDKPASDTLATSDDDVSDADADDNMDDDEDEQVDEELRARVRAVLKESGMADPDDEEEDAEDAQSDAGSESSVEFSDLGDDEMMLLDDKLAEVFRQRVSAVRDQKEAKQEAIALRFKVLELVETFARKQPQSALMLDLILPLYELWSHGDEDTEQLGAKAKTLLLGRISRAKTVPDEFDADQVGALLQRMHAEARESQSNDVSNVSQALSLYLTKVALSKSGNDVKAALGGKLVDIYRESLLDYLLRKASRLRHEFLIDAFRRFPLLGWELRSELLDNCRPGAATRAFRQVQVMSMLQAVLTQIAQRAEKAQVLAFVPEISTCFAQIVHDSCDAASTSALSANHMKDTIRFVLQAARISARIEAASPDKLQSAWKVAKLQDAAEKLQSSKRYKASTSIHDLIKQLLKQVQPDAEGGAEGSKKQNKKRAADDSTAKVNGKAASPAKKVKASAK